METLKRSIYEEEKKGSLTIIEESETDILTDDFNEDRHISYHLIPPTKEWVESRMLFAPSVPEKDRAWIKSRIVPLLLPHTDMLICLNRIIFVKEEIDEEADESDFSSEDTEFLEREMDCEACEFPDIGGIVGVKWHTQSSVMILLGEIEKTTKEIQLDEEEGETIYEDGLCMTVLHELRHLGLECNPLLPEEEYPVKLFPEPAVEAWASANYKF
jgi:hypothetical protein